MRFILILSLLCVGCIPEKAYVVPSFIPALSVAFGFTATGSPAPSPDPTPSDECETCGGQGWLGDGTTKMDCPDCETPWSQLPGEASTPSESFDEGSSSAIPVAGQASENLSTSDIVMQQKINRIIARLKYRPIYCANIPDAIEAAGGDPWLLFLLTDPSTAADRMMLVPEADGLVIAEIYADDEYRGGTYRDELPAHEWPSVTLYRGRTELKTLDLQDVAASLKKALEEL